jgi:hypothetical protein
MISKVSATIPVSPMYMGGGCYISRQLWSIAQYTIATNASDAGSYISIRMCLRMRMKMKMKEGTLLNAITNKNNNIKNNNSH